MLGDQFRESVQAGAVEELPQEGWFVGVNGVPLGPIPLDDLRELAVAGHIDRRSLVWREGQGEWRPLGRFPGLVRVIDDGAPPMSVSLLPEAPSVPPPSVAPAPNAAPSPRSNGANGQHIATGFDAVRADAGERPSAWGDLDDEDDEDEQPTTVKGRVSVFPAPGSLPGQGAPIPQPRAPPLRELPQSAPPPSSVSAFGLTASVRAVPTPAPPVSAPPVGRDSFGAFDPGIDGDAAPMRSSSRSRWYLIAAAILLAFALGAVVMRWMGSSSEKSGAASTPPATEASVAPSLEPRPHDVGADEPEEGKVAAEAIAARGADVDGMADDGAPAEKMLPPPGSERVASAGPAPQAGSASSATGAKVPSASHASAPVAPRAAAPSSPVRKPAATGSLLAGIGSPQTPGPGTGPRSDEVASGSLDAPAVQRTVRRYSPAVRQNCWQRALNARAPGTPSSAKVTAIITIDPGGRVQAVSVAGAPRGYPGLARCIEGSVKGWQFPRAGAQTVTNVPFMFVGQ